MSEVQGEERQTVGVDLKTVWKKNLEAKKENQETGFATIPLDILRVSCLSAKAKIVYIVLLSFVRKKGSGRCNPSYDLIIKSAGMSRWQVGKAVEELRYQKFIEIYRNGRSFSYSIRSIPERNNLAAKAKQDQDRFSKKFKAVTQPQSELKPAESV